MTKLIVRLIIVATLSSAAIVAVAAPAEAGARNGSLFGR